MTYVTVQFDNKDLQFTNKEGFQKAVVHILGRVTSMTRRPIQNFEEKTVVTSPTHIWRRRPPSSPSTRNRLF